MKKLIIVWLTILTLWLVFLHALPLADGWYFHHYKSGSSRVCEQEDGRFKEGTPKSTFRWIGLYFDDYTQCEMNL